MKSLRYPQKFIIAALMILAMFLSLILVALIYGPFDIKKHHYPTLQDAEADRVFEQGWLPSIIPTSASDIELSNNLDLNTSIGSFSFHRDDFDVFVQNIKKSTAQDTRLLGEKPEMNSLRERGYVSLYYRSNSTIWRFFIHSETGHCKYWAQFI